MRLSGTKTGAVNQYRGLGNQLWDLAGNRPSLDLRFAESKSLVDATTGTTLVDHTRASSGTYVGSDGLIKTATTNLLLRSEEFDDASWTRTTIGNFGTVSFSDAAISPDGKQTADLIVPTSGGLLGISFVSQAITKPAVATTYTLSCFGKKQNFDVLRVFARDTSTNNNRVEYAISLDDGSVVTTPTAVGAFTAVSGSVVSYPNGWYRAQLVFTTSTETSITTRIYANDSIATVGDDVSGVYIWGAQLEQSSTVGEYVKTTSTKNSAPRFDHDPTTGESLGLFVEEQRTNLLLRSEEFDTTWTLEDIQAFGSGSIANAITAPDGLMTADLIVENTATSTHGVSQSVSVASGVSYTLSVFAKAKERTYVEVVLPASGFGTPIRVELDLTTGSTLLVTGTATVSATAYPNGWYRIAVTAAATASTSILTSVRAKPSSGAAIYTGDGTSGIYIWGAQLEAGAFPTSYIPTEGSAVTRAADVASISGSNFSSWYNTTQGTVFTSQKTPAVDSQQGAYWFSASPTVGRGIAATIDTRNVAQRLTVYNRDDVSASSLSVSPLVNGVQQKIAHSWSGGTQSASLNGLLSTGSYNAVYPGINQLSIGYSEISAGSPQYLSGAIKRLTYWQTRLPDETLQGITQ